MNIMTLDKGLVVYQFDPPEGEIEGLNFMAIVENGEALFLDTGYSANMEQALEDLTQRKAKPVQAIISHYHPDHDGGLALLDGIEVWASDMWKTTADQWRPYVKGDQVKPDRLISAREELCFGERKLELFPLPGHSDDSLAILIDKKWLYVADSILLTNEGEPLLPSVHSRPVSRHVDAIDWLSGKSEYIFIPGHGSVMNDREFRERDLANRTRYLSAIAHAAGEISFEEATAGCEPPFRGKEWHGHNYQ